MNTVVCDDTAVLDVERLMAQAQRAGRRPD